MRVPSYRLHHSTGQARVTLNGRDHLLGPYGSPESKEKYGRLIAEYSSSGKAASYGKAKKHLIEDLLLAYVKFAREYYAGGSEFTNMKLAIKPMLELYGTLPSESFGPTEYRACREWWLRDSRRSRQYINKQMKRLLRVLKWATSHSHVKADNFIACQCVAPLARGRVVGLRETKKILPVADSLVEATLEHTTRVVGDMIRFQRLTGCRPGELCALTPAMVNRAGDVWLIDLAKHKTAHRGRQRVIFVGPKAQAILAPYLLRAQDSPCFSPKESERQRLADKHAARKTPLKYGNSPGTNRARKPRKAPSDQYTSESYARSIKYTCKRNGLTPWAPNQLRHSAATEIRKNFGLEAAQLLLGHASADITQVYAERDLAKGIAVAREVG